MHAACAWRVHARAVAEIGRAPGLIQRDPVGHAVTQPARYRLHIVGKRLSGTTVEPAAIVLQCLRQIPVIERRYRRDATLEQIVDQALVKVQPARVGSALACGQNPRPGNRKTVGAMAETPHHLDLPIHPALIVGGNVSRVAAMNLARRRAEHVPNGWATPVFTGRALDLVGGGGSSPEKACRETGGKLEVTLSFHACVRRCRQRSPPSAVWALAGERPDAG